ncbi:MAG: phosphoribosylanthranilate isomerase, partial [Prevotellaceae bacterium]|nr:phosphoribosylanthranilate isomerase [Prevotellaceae bacterium]
MQRLIKVCGMCDGENIGAVEQAGADLLGFIFYAHSPRYVSTRPTYLPLRAKRVGVFVDAQTDHILRTAEQYELDYVQLHGDESPEECLRIQSQGLRVIKALHNIRIAKHYEGACSYLLFDTPCKSRGGSGKTFDWAELQLYDGRTPFFLSGGIGTEHIEKLKAFAH